MRVIMRKISIALLLMGLSFLVVANKKVEKLEAKMSYEKLQSQQTVLGTVWMQTSGEYRAAVYQVYNIAKDRFLIEKNMLESTDKKLAVIVDIDETVLDNMYTQTEYIREGTNYSSKDWDAWAKAEKGIAMPGAVEFVNFVYENGGEVFYLTNRKEAEREVTLSNLLKEKFIVDNEHLILKTAESSKENRRNEIEKNYKVIIYIGDDLNDFIDQGKTIEERKQQIDRISQEFGRKYFIIPNPVYGGFESAINKDYYKVDHEKRVKMREDVLKGWK